LIAFTERSTADHSRAISVLQTESPSISPALGAGREGAEETGTLADLAGPYRDRELVALGARQRPRSLNRIRKGGRAMYIPGGTDPLFRN
jgi:hypothetical protein